MKSELGLDEGKRGRGIKEGEGDEGERTRGGEAVGKVSVRTQSLYYYTCVHILFPARTARPIGRAGLSRTVCQGGVRVEYINVRFRRVRVSLLRATACVYVCTWMRERFSVGRL